MLEVVRFGLSQKKIPSVAKGRERKTLISERVISCQSGTDVALTRKSHRWVVLDVRPIGGVD